jgi:hypothetical protein
MTETPQNAPEPGSQPAQTGAEVEELLKALRRKEGNWVEWGRSCQTLQKAGFSPQVIFEETGFEPIQQNQVIVAAQVYATMLNVGVSDAVRTHFERRGSDILYELRILTQPERASVAELVLEKQLDMDEAREVAKAVKEFSRLGAVPEGFTSHPGDAVAYQAWKQARQKSDFQERSRLIARGLKFAHSDTARQKIEKLLTDFTVTPTRPSPRLPIYRLESADDMPRVLPVVGKLPLSKADMQEVPILDEVGPFKLVQFSGTGAWVPVPGWQVIRNAEDPVVFLCDSDRLPNPLPGQPEEVLVVVDRAQRQWDADSYFVIEKDDLLHLQWFEERDEDIPLLGRIILIMRPKKVLDEDYTRDPWQIDE